MYGVMIADYYLVKREKIVRRPSSTRCRQRAATTTTAAGTTSASALAISGLIAIGWELCTQLFHILPENDLGWVIGAIAGAVAYTTTMRAPERT